jgi:integrase
MDTFVKGRHRMSDYLPTPADAPGRYAAATFDLYQSSTEALDDLASHAKSARTLQGYRSDWRGFRTWAGTKGIAVPGVADDHVDLGTEPIPPALVMLYLADIQGDLKPATVTHHLAAIRHFHHQAELTSPTDHPKVRETLAGFTRKHAVEPHRAEPLFLAELKAGLPAGDDLRAVRDRALLLVGWWGAFRRSELVAISTADLSKHDQGMIVKIPKSKTDQAGAGQKVALHYRDDLAIDPVKALRAWLKASSVKGPVFRSVRGVSVGSEALNDRAVSRLTKATAERAGLDPSGYSAHSLRAGFVSECDRRGIHSGAVRAVTRHTSDAMLAVYDRPGELFSGSAGAYFEGV